MVVGVVEFFDMRKGFGNLKTEEGDVYFFSKSSLTSKGKPEKDQNVEFEAEDGEEIEEGKKPVAVSVSPVDGESFNTERSRRKKPESKGSKKGESLEARITAMEKQLDAIVGKINEICEKTETKTLGKKGMTSRGKGSRRPRGKGAGKKNEEEN